MNAALVGIWAALAVAALIMAFGLWLVRVPAADRRFRDPPPRFWALTWPLVQAMAHSMAAHLSPVRITRIEAALRAGGLDHALTAPQFIAGRLVAAMVAVACLLLAWAPRGLAPWGLLACAGALGHALPRSWLRDRIERRRRAILKELPFFLDLMTLAVEAGLSMSSALAAAVSNLPPGALRAELDRVLRDMRAGRSRPDALRQFADRIQAPAVTNLVSGHIAVERQGANLGALLRAQALQRRVERFQRAEKLAMQAPVKLLMPLTICIFPGTFIVLFFPIVMRLLDSGVL